MKFAFFVLFLLVVLAGGFLIVRNNEGELTLEEAQDTASLDQEDGEISKGEGKLIAGSTTPYKELTKAEYDKANSERKVIFLNFYANWCPVCRAEEPDLVHGFNQLKNPDVIGFRVNFKDDETDELEGQLALDYGIIYQHSKVIIIDGQQVYRQIAERWDSDRVISELGSL